MVNKSLLSNTNLSFRTDADLACRLTASSNSVFTLYGADGSQTCSLLNVNNLGCAQIGGVNLDQYLLQDGSANLAGASTLGSSQILSVSNIGSHDLDLSANTTIGGQTITTVASLGNNSINLHSGSTLNNSQILSLSNIADQSSLNLHADATINGVQIASRNYVDNAIEGIDWKQQVEVRMEAEVTISNPGTSSFDGVTLTSGQRVLLVGNGASSGIYTFNGSSSAMTRVSDLNSNAEFHGAAVFVKQGSHAATAWTCSSFTTVAEPGTSITDFSTFAMGTHVPVFAQFAGATLLTHSAGIDRTNNQVTLDQSYAPTWTGDHDFQATVSISGARDRSVPNTASGAPNFSSAVFAGYNGTITDTNNTHTGTKYAAFNHFADGTFAGISTDATYNATAIYASAPTLSGDYHANSKAYAIMCVGETLFAGDMRVTSNLNVNAAVNSSSLDVGSGNFTVGSNGNFAGAAATSTTLDVGSGLLSASSGAVSTSGSLAVATTIRSGTGDAFQVSTSGGVTCTTVSGTTGSFSSTLGATGLISSAAGLKVTVSSVDKFTVSNTGDVTCGQADLTGDFSVATNAFTITASTGAVSMASGDVTINGTTGALSGTSAAFPSSLSAGSGDAFYVDGTGNAEAYSLVSTTALSVGTSAAFHVTNLGAIDSCFSIDVTNDAVVHGEVTVTEGVSAASATLTGALSCASGATTINGSNGYFNAPWADFSGGFEAGAHTDPAPAPFIVTSGGACSADSLTVADGIIAGTMNFVVSSGGAITAAASITTTGEVACASVDSSGGITGTTGTFSGAVAGATFESTSDQRLKTNVTQVSSNGELFDQVKPVTFVWTEDSNIANNQDEQGQVQKQWGFLAQEVGALYPDLLRGNASKYGLAYDGFFAILVAEVQALRQRTAALEAQLAAQ